MYAVIGTIIASVITSLLLYLLMLTGWTTVKDFLFFKICKNKIKK